MPIMVTKKVEQPVKLPLMVRPYVSLGCDPEFFIQNKKGETVGSELLIKKDLHPADLRWAKAKVIVDGVQAEINPTATDCRANLANSIVQCFKALKTQLDAAKGEFQTTFETTVEISKEELNKLQEKSRQFGCAPSLNGYAGATSVIPYKGDEYLKRSAGGHIHIGLGKLDPKIHAERIRRITILMDLFVGIPGVLLDRDPANIERRKLYGRAGEYRLPPHGYEYRTPSNFWLRSYPLMSLIFGFTKIAVQLDVAYNHQNKLYTTKDFVDWLIEEQLDLKELERTINENDFKAAMKFYETFIKPFVKATIQDSGIDFAISEQTLKYFEAIVEIGIDTLWPKSRNMVEYWASLPDCHTGGFYDMVHGNAFKATYDEHIKKKETKPAKLNTN